MVRAAFSHLTLALYDFKGRWTWFSRWVYGYGWAFSTEGFSRRYECTLYYSVPCFVIVSVVLRIYAWMGSGLVYLALRHRT